MKPRYAMRLAAHFSGFHFDRIRAAAPEFALLPGGGHNSVYATAKIPTRRAGRHG